MGEERGKDITEREAKGSRREYMGKKGCLKLNRKTEGRKQKTLELVTEVKRNSIFSEKEGSKKVNKGKAVKE